MSKLKVGDIIKIIKVGGADSNTGMAEGSLDSDLLNKTGKISKVNSTGPYKYEVKMEKGYGIMPVFRSEIELVNQDWDQ